MTTLILLLIAPLAWPIAAKLIWKQELTLGELGLNLLVGVLIVTAGWYLGRYVQTADTEILNGSISSKSYEHVSCEHSYSCNCRESCSGSGKDRSCSTTCETCYDHSYDVDWNLHTTVGNLKINRVDRQGVSEPPRFSLAQIGDPVAKSSSFTNYIKASPDSLFSTASEKEVLAQFKGHIPRYPSEIYDYHYVNRVLPVGVTVPDLSAWNKDLALRLKTLGPSKQANVVIVLTNDVNPAFADALRVAWLGGKKNDVIVVLGTPVYPAIAWARVISWTDKEVFKVQLRDALLDLKTVERKAILDAIEQHVAKDFVRKRMADFEYLKELIEPPPWVIGLLVLLSTAASIWTSVALSRNSTRSGGFSRFRY